jgi:hypothetical protein
MEHRDETIENKRIVLDGNTYTGCTFRNCYLVFRATEPCTLSVCGFYDCKWVFEGPAQSTIDFLTSVYHEMGEGGRNLVEATFQNVRTRGHRPLGGDPPTS